MTPLDQADADLAGFQDVLASYKAQLGTTNSFSDGACFLLIAAGLTITLLLVSK
jgi:hypothetical protein